MRRSRWPLSSRGGICGCDGGIVSVRICVVGVGGIGIWTAAACCLEVLGASGYPQNRRPHAGASAVQQVQECSAVQHKHRKRTKTVGKSSEARSRTCELMLCY